MTAMNVGTWIGSTITALRIDLPDNPPSLPSVMEIGYVQYGDGTYLPTTKVLDTSPNARQFTPQTGVVRVDGPNGYAVDTTYGGLYSASEVGLPMGSSPFTIAVWFKLTSLPSTYGRLAYFGDTGTTGKSNRTNISSTGQLHISNSSLSINSPAGTVSVDGIWHLFIAINDGATTTLFLDAVEKVSGAQTFATIPGSGLYIGNEPAGVQRLTGQLTRPQIWSRAMAISEAIGLCKLPSTNGESLPVTGSGAFAKSVNPYFGGFNSFLLGSSVASVAGQITPTGPIFHVTGALAITGIVIPYAGFCGTVTLIPDGAFTWTAAGNIALAGTAVVNKAVIFTYDPTAVKWYPSYV
jgi:hypothetical protein